MILKVSSHLHELPLVHAEAGGAPVEDLVKRQRPAVGEDDRKTARLQSLQEPETAKTSSSRHQTELGVGEQVVIIPSVKRNEPLRVLICCFVKLRIISQLLLSLLVKRERTLR